MQERRGDFAEDLARDPQRVQIRGSEGAATRGVRLEGVGLLECRVEHQVTVGPEERAAGFVYH